MTTKNEKRVRAAKTAINDATLAAATHLADQYTWKNPDIPARDPGIHFDTYWPDIIEAVVPVAQAIAAKRAGFDNWEAFEAARAKAEADDEAA